MTPATTLPTDMQLRICATVAWSCSPNTLSGLFWNWGPAAFRLRSYSRRQRPPAPSVPCARRHGTCTRPASTAGLAARFCRRGRGQLREPFPAHALGMDRIGPCLALGYCRLPTQPCEHGDSVMSLWDLARSSSLSPPCQLFLLSRPEHGRIIPLSEVKPVRGVLHSLDCP